MGAELFFDFQNIQTCKTAKVLRTDLLGFVDGHSPVTPQCRKNAEGIVELWQLACLRTTKVDIGGGGMYGFVRVLYGRACVATSTSYGFVRVSYGFCTGGVCSWFWLRFPPEYKKVRI